MRESSFRLTVFHLVVLGQVVQVAVLHGDHVVQLCFVIEQGERT